jgi:hypothetical protein
MLMNPIGAQRRFRLKGAHMVNSHETSFRLQLYRVAEQISHLEHDFAELLEQDCRDLAAALAITRMAATQRCGRIDRTNLDCMLTQVVARFEQEFGDAQIHPDARAGLRSEYRWCIQCAGRQSIAVSIDNWSQRDSAQIWIIDPHARGADRTMLHRIQSTAHLERVIHWIHRRCALRPLHLLASTTAGQADHEVRGARPSRVVTCQFQRRSKPSRSDRIAREFEHAQSSQPNR